MADGENDWLVGPCAPEEVSKPETEGRGVPLDSPEATQEYEADGTDTIPWDFKIAIIENGYMVGGGDLYGQTLHAVADSTDKKQVDLGIRYVQCDTVVRLMNKILSELGLEYDKHYDYNVEVRLAGRSNKEVKGKK